jgi:FkbM family methyltransferase
MTFLHSTYRALFARPAFRRLNESLFRMSLSGLGVMNFQNDQVSGEEHFVHKLLPDILKSPMPVCFDVGANEGNFSALLLAALPGAHIHAFEPHPRNFARLKQRVAQSTRVVCHQTAVGDSSGTTTLYDRSDLDGSSHASLHEGVITAIHGKNAVAVEVPLDTLDQFVAKNTIQAVDFLKIDTEGHEMAVLRGARELIASGRIRCIQFEFNEMNVESRVFLRDFRRALPGFDLFRLLPRALLPLRDTALETELFAYQNVIAIRRV